MALVNMRLSAEEAAEMMGGPMSPEAMEYPPGLCLSLNEDDLARLGLPLPAAGQCMRISAEGCVKSVNTRVEGEEGEVEACVYIQITDMSVAPFTPKKSLAKTMYPDLPEA